MLPISDRSPLTNDTAQKNIGIGHVTPQIHVDAKRISRWSFSIFGKAAFQAIDHWNFDGPGRRERPTFYHYLRGVSLEIKTKIAKIKKLFRRIGLTVFAAILCGSAFAQDAMTDGQRRREPVLERGKVKMGTLASPGFVWAGFPIRMPQIDKRCWKGLTVPKPTSRSISRHNQLFRFRMQANGEFGLSFSDRSKPVSLETKECFHIDDRAGASYFDFTPQAPDGLESNWLPTGRDFFLLFRLNGPAEGRTEIGWSL